MKDSALVHPLFPHIFQTKNLYSMALIQPRTDRNTIFRVTKMLSWEHGFPSGIQLKAVPTIARYLKKRYDFFCINWRVEIWIWVRESRFLHWHMQWMWDIIRRSQNISSLQDFFPSRGKSFFIYKNHLTVPKALGVPTLVSPKQRVSWNNFKIPTVNHQG